MDHSRASRGIQALLPWAALAAVSVFAVAQMKQRRAAEDRCDALLQARVEPAPAAQPASWIAEAKQATTPAAVEALRTRARKAAPEDVDRLALELKGAHHLTPVVAKFAGALPDSPQASALLATLLDVGPSEDPAERVAAIGPSRLMNGTILARTFRDARVEMVRELLPHAAARPEPWTEIDLAAFAVALGVSVLAEDPEEAATASRAAGVLRVPRLARGLVRDLVSPHAPVRAAAAYALSRVPDREEVRSEILGAMGGLQADPSPEVRTAAGMLQASMSPR